MVNLVIVSHCQKLAEGVRDLAEQMAGDSVCILAVGGFLDDQGGERLGTDPLRIRDAIEAAWTTDGVLILVDLGSAVLSAELAIDLLPEERRSRCLVSNAPLVEGAVVAALEAGMNHCLETVNREAEATGQFVKVQRDSQ